MGLPRLYFDLTTSLCWGGAPVGITRVEREIARRAAGRSHIPMRYCFFHRPTQSYYELTPPIAEAVLAGGFSIDRSDLLAATFRSSEAHDSLQAGLATINPGASYDARSIAVSARHLSHLTLAQIVEARSSNAFVQVNRNGQRSTMLSREITSGPIKLSAACWIINGGLDWEHKDLRAIRHLKARKKFKYVAIIYDLIPLLFPHYVVPFYIDLLKKYFGELFWTADMALCISDATRHDAEAYLSDWRMPRMPLYSWPLGCDIEVESEVTDLESHRLKGRSYLLYVSTIEPRKSHRTVVEAFERGLRAGALSDDACCVFVGRVGWNSDNLLQEIRLNPLLRDRIIILSGISDAELVQVYKGARFVVFPSKYEGYGLSLVEAMALGKACISGTAGSLCEVGGDAPLYIDPYDIKAWSEAIIDFMANDETIKRYEQRSSVNNSPVTWDLSADQFYEKLHTGMAALS